ncbi:MAG: hypothetical protein IPK26_17430 [Planctomycetes bacterium]|nr:hypothetical protein [Planctomycetota bacterium]
MRIQTAVAVALATTWVSCGASAPVTPEQRAQEERRLLAPFTTGAEVGCGELFLETTGNFAQLNIGSPSHDSRLHGRPRKEIADGYTDTVWTNPSGTVEGALKVTIGEAGEVGAFVPGRYTTFTVLRQVRLRVLSGVHPLTLNVRAEGVPLVVLEAGAARDLAEFTVADGVATRK